MNTKNYFNFNIRVFLILFLIVFLIYFSSAESSSAIGSSSINSATFAGSYGGEFSGGYGGSYVYSNPQYFPTGFQGDGAYYSYYGLWPSGTQDYNEMCRQRQDFLVQIAPGGCTPLVVRSDLLAEQNVPVFCRLQAIQINPLIQIQYIKNINFVSRGKQPSEVGGVGYYRPKVLLSPRINVQGFPTLNNIGYAVIILKRNPNEKNMSDYVSGNLTARITYDAPNAIGPGKSDIIIPALSDSEWKQSYTQYAFFDGKAFLRVDKVADSYADVSVYIDADTKISSFRVEKGKTSQQNFVPGFYCVASYSVTLIDSVSNDVYVKINVDGDDYSPRKGESFANGLCRLNSVNSEGGETGSVSVTCNGKTFSLALGVQSFRFEVDGVGKDASVGDLLYTDVSGKKVYFGTIGKDPSGNPVAVILRIDKDKEFGSAIKTALDDYIKIPQASFTLGEILTLSEGEEDSFDVTNKIKFLNYVNSGDTSSGNPAFEDAFKSAIAGYKEVDDNYPAVKYNSLDGLGKQSLIKGIELSKGKNKQATIAEFSSRLKEKYDYQGYDSEVNYDSSKSTFIVDSGNMVNVVVLKSINEPSFEQKGVFLMVDRKEMKISKNDEYIESKDSGTGNYIQLKSFDSNGINIEAKCSNGDNNKIETITGDAGKIALGSQKVICNKNIFVKQINIQKNAKLVVTANAKNIASEINISYSIGIEKRAIQLSPIKTAERITRLNQSIGKWQNVSDSLTKVVKGMKAACFATTAALQVKNLFGNIGGKAIARQEVMRGSGGWNELCNEALANGAPKEGSGMAPGPYNSLDDCFRKNNDKIEADVNLYSSKMDSINSEISKLESDGGFVKSGGLLGGKSVDYTGAKNAYFIQVVEDTTLRDVEVNNGKTGEEKETLKVGDVFSGLKNESISYEDLRQIKLYSEILKSKPSESARSVANRKLYDILNEIQSTKNYDNGLSLAEQSGKKNKVIGKLGYSGRDLARGQGPYYYGGAKISIDVGAPVPIHMVEDKENPSTRYYVQLENTNGDRYSIVKVYAVNADGGIGNEIKDGDISTKLNNQYPYFSLRDAGSYMNEYKNPEVRFYETDPYKGMPAVVPIDIKQGWYAATKQTLPTFGGIKAYEDSGRVSSFWLCNVGNNGREEFNAGLGDDECEMFNVNTGQPLNVFPGLPETKVKELVSRAINALEKVASQYSPGIQRVSVPGVGSVKVGNPAVNLPGTQCQDFMSPKDCQLMFNVCDPVICPSSRCNLGGKYYASDVVQTGIVGGLFMCLPNYKQGIIVPVCLTGIQSGIDNYVSILKASRDCLQENLNTGQYVGICDEITAIYTCEFFWNQLAPAMNAILPKLLESVAGNRVKGGGEYLNVQSAWSNMQNSIGYFKNVYGVNALKAFRVRSTEEVGTPVCKAFVSVKYPNKFKTLIEPDSPSQFSAWFTEIKQSDAAVPPISQYKVYYHIFAGNDIGVHYSIYLKDISGTSFYQTSGVAYVATGFIGKGEYADEARDFTAPSGYKQLCVSINAQEKCGFQQVSTSFALNYLRDSYVKNQITENQISSQADCISGTPNALALLNPNLQAGVQNTIDPKIYNSGVIRVCATSNPGLSTDPLRWQKVGICDDSKIGCWLDRESVGKAITPEDVGLKNATISELDAVRNAIAENGKSLVGDDQIASSFLEIETKINGLYKNKGDKDTFDSSVSDIRVLIQNIDDKYILTSDQTGILKYLEANLDAAVANNAWVIFQKSRQVTQVTAPPPTTGGTQTTPTSTTSSGTTNPLSTSDLGNFMIYLNDNYKKNNSIGDIVTCNCGNKCQQYAESIGKYSKSINGDPLLVLALMMQESSCNTLSDSSNPAKSFGFCQGASYGLMQISGRTWCDAAHGLPANAQDCKSNKDYVNNDCITTLKNDFDKNIGVGVSILGTYYNTAGTVYQNSLKLNNCQTRQDYPILFAYTGWDKALRQYNGVGCTSENFDDAFVSKIDSRFNELKRLYKNFHPEILRA